MVSIRSILTAITFFTAFAFAAPTALDSGNVALAKRADPSQIVGEILQYFENLGSDIRNLTSNFETIAGKAVSDAGQDIEGLIQEFEGVLSSNSTAQGLLQNLNPANITPEEVTQLVNAGIAVLKDLLNFIPSAATWIVQAGNDAGTAIHKLLTLPHEFIQFVLTLFGQLAGLIPVFGTGVQFFINLVKAADNTLYQFL